MDYAFGNEPGSRLRDLHCFKQPNDVDISKGLRTFGSMGGCDRIIQCPNICELHCQINVITRTWLVFTTWVGIRTARYRFAFCLQRYTLSAAILSHNGTARNHQKLQDQEHWGKNVAVYCHVHEI